MRNPQPRLGGSVDHPVEARAALLGVGPAREARIELPVEIEAPELSPVLEHQPAFGCGKIDRPHVVPLLVAIVEPDEDRPRPLGRPHQNARAHSRDWRQDADLGRRAVDREDAPILVAVLVADEQNVLAVAGPVLPRDRAAGEARQRFRRADIISRREPDIEHALERREPGQPFAVGAEPGLVTAGIAEQGCSRNEGNCRHARLCLAQMRRASSSSGPGIGHHANNPAIGLTSSLAGNTLALSARSSTRRWSFSTPFKTARRSIVGLRSRPSWRSAGLRPGQSAMTRPPFNAPPTRTATVPVPWSVPSVPLMRAVRPNSVMTATTVSLQASAMAFSIAAMAVSSAPSRAASCPSAAPSLMCVSQPTKPAAPTRGPSGCARYFAAAPAVVATYSRRRAMPAPGASPSRGVIVSMPPSRARLNKARRPSNARASLVSVWRERSSRRIWVSSLAGSRRCGAHDITGAGPRTTRGVTGPTAKALRPRGLTRPSASSDDSARLSQPLSVLPGLASPLSSTSWPSKCERSR